MRIRFTLCLLVTFLLILPVGVVANPTGTAIWRSGASTVPLQSSWDGTSFGPSDSTVEVADFRIMAGAEAPTRDEKIIVGVDEGNNVAMLVWDGSVWSVPPFSPMASVSEAFWWGCDVAYMSQNGDALIVWNNGSAGTECISYRTGNGFTWSSEDTISVPVAGEPKHMHLAANPLSDEMVLVVSNEFSKDYAIVWDGSAWGNVEILDNSGAGDDRTDIYVTYEQQSGDAMVTYGWGLPAVYYSIWDGSVWSGSAGLAKPADASGTARWTTLAADPRSDRIALGVLTADQNVWLCVWDGSTWESPLTATNSTTGATYPGVAVAFEGQSGTAVAAYGEGSQVRYRTWTDGGGWSSELQAVNLGETPNSLMLDAAPDSNHIMLSVQDGASDLNCVLWDGEVWGLADELETDTHEVTNQPFLFLWDLDEAGSGGRRYYVGPGGDDDDDGLTPATAWHSIDNGDQKGLLAPGDTVLIQPGVYLANGDLALTISGTEDQPILYMGERSDMPIIRGLDGVNAVFHMQGDNTILSYVDISADPIATISAIGIDADSCTVQECRIHNLCYDGIAITGDRNLVLKNVIFSCNRNGIRNSETGQANRYHGNTIWDNAFDGIQIVVPASGNRVFNNLVTDNGDDGIFGAAANVCAYNDVWNNLGGDYVSGVSDSAGGISADPGFVNAEGDNFHLLATSPAVDAGLDLGYSYDGSAPDMGAYEYVSFTPTNYYVSPTGNDDDDGLTVGTAWASLDNGDLTGVLVPGDTVNVLVGTYTPGRYAWLTTSGTSADPITYCSTGGGDAVLDLEGIGQSAILLEGKNVVIDGFELRNSGHKGLYLAGDSCIVKNCNIHDSTQDGIYIEGARNLIHRNRIAACGGPGISAVFGAARNVFTHNTIDSCTQDGIYLQVGITTARALNNIVTSNDRGIVGDPGNVCAFNDVWNNTSGDYTGGVADSAGGISDDPLFIDPETGDFRLQRGSPAIDAGLDLGYAYNGDAPDMGAVESDYPDSVAYIVVTPATATVTEGGSQQFTTGGYASDSTFVRDLTDSVAWSTGDPSGMVEAGGLYTAGHDVSPPDYSVVAVYGSMRDSAAVTVVTDGSLSYVRVELENGTAFPDTTLTADNDTTRFYCRGYDSGDNLIGDYVANWQIIGDATGVVLPVGSISTTLEVRTPGACRIVAVQGATVKDTSGVITCVPGEPAALVISPDEATVSADSTLQFTAAAYDADGNPAGPIPPPAWEVLGGIGTIDAAGLLTAVTVGTGNIAAATLALADTTGAIMVVPGDIASIDVVPTATAVLEGGTQQYAANGYDSDLNFVADLAASAAWTTSDPSGSITTGGLYTAGHDLSPPAYWVFATYSSLSDSGQIFVATDGTLKYVRVELDDGTPFPDTTMTTDNDTTVLYCRGYDSADNPLGDQSVTWMVTGEDSIGTVSPGTGTSTTLMLAMLGTGHVVAKYNVSIKDTSGMITCVAGQPAELVVSPDTATVPADSTIQFEAVSLDADGNTTNPQIAPAWEVLGGIGTIDGTGSFAPTIVGVGSIVATGGGLSDTTGSITVIAGVLDSLFISPNRDTISADTTRQFTATGFDSKGNPVSNLGILTWAVVGGIGTIDAGGRFDATAVGTGFVKVTSNLGPWAVTDTIVVIPGEVACIDVMPAENLIVEETTYQFNALAYDSDSNYVYDATDVAAWNTTDPSGSISATGLYTAGHDPSPPNYYVKATVGMFADSSKVTVLSGGVLRYVRIEWADGSPVTDTTLTTDVDDSHFHCRGYNSADSLLGDVSVTWLLVGEDSIGSVTPGPATHTVLELSEPGTGRMAAVYSTEIADTSGIITCLPGVPASLVISPDTATVTAGEDKQFTTTAFDADGNQSDPVTIDAWEVLGGVGSISATGRFTGQTVGTGAVACRGGDLADTTEAITVVAGPLADIEILPDSVDVTLGGTVAFSGQGIDGYGNSADVGNLTWQVLGNIGSIDASGIFTAQNVGSGRIAATSSIGGVADTNSIVRVLTSDLLMLVVTPDTASIKVGGGAQFVASGFDAGYGPADVGQVSWEVLGGIGTIDSEGTFLATTQGMGRISATSNINGIGDTTNMIVVGIPTVTELPLGNSIGHANQTDIPILALRIANAFDAAETLTGLTVRDASNGAGSPAQVRSNIASVRAYLDSDRNSVLSPADEMLTEAAAVQAVTPLSFSPVTIPPGSDIAIFVAMDIQQFPHDADALDMFLLAAGDIQLGGGTPVAGPDTINSLGRITIDGLVAEQVALVSNGNGTVGLGDAFAGVLTVDIPRNGYSNDVLKIFSVFNAGGADTFDIDSMMLYADDGNGTWDGDDDEIRVGPMSFTGDQWEISGLSRNIGTPTTRFHVGVRLKSGARNGTDIALGIPLHGLEMASGNDGPIDLPVDPVDTFTIVSAEVASVRVIDLAGHDVIPGQATGAVLALDLLNTYDLDLRIECLDLSFTSVDPAGAGQDDLESQLGDVRLWLDGDGNPDVLTDDDSLISTAQITDGIVHFSIPGLLLPQGGSVALTVDADVGLYTGKNANTIGFSLISPTHICFDRSVNLVGAFPLTNPNEFRINIFPAAGVIVHPVEGTTIYGGQTDCLVLDFELPRNGYAEDRLRSLSLRNTGQASGVKALEAVRLWADVDGGGLSPLDIHVGDFAYADGTWRLSRLSHPLIDETTRLFVTVDVTSGDFEGGTVQFEIPIAGAQYLSGADGPDDESIINPMSHFLFPANRITVIPIPQEHGTVRPGAENAQVLTFALYNGYVDQPQVLDAVRLTNRSGTASTPEWADHELGQVSLYSDLDASKTFGNDSLLAAGYFSDARLNLGGLNVEVEPESLYYFFVVSEVPLDAIDCDTIAVTVEAHSDFTFTRSVNINGDLPVSRGGDLVIDGSVQAQYQVLPLSSRILSPGDERVTLLSLRPASNGDQPDVMQGLVIGNSGDADTSEFSSLDLWVDGDDDGVWSDGDTYIGDFHYANEAWSIVGIDLEIEMARPVLIITGDVTARATPNAEFRGFIPVNGCQYASANDGPIDAPLAADHALIVSSSGLRVAYGPLKSEYSVGQNLTLRVYVTNLLDVPVEGACCNLRLAGSEDGLALVGSNAEPVTLEPGAIGEFTYDYTAVQHGTVYWRMQAYSSSHAESSAVVTTEQVLIQAAPTAVRLQLISSIPTAVTRGQSHVFPLSIRCRHADSSRFVAPLRLDSLRIEVEDGMGQPQAADRVFSRMILGSGYTNLAIVEALASESSILLAFSEPAVVAAGGDIVLSLRVDIESLATAASFALAIDNESSIRFVDDNTGGSIPADPAVTFPLRTAVCAINDPSQNIAVSYEPVTPNTVNYGQRDVGIMEIILRHGGGVTNSQIQFTAVTLEFVDDAGAPIAAGDLLTRVGLIHRQGPVGGIHDFEGGSSTVHMVLTAPPVLSPGQSDTITVQASIRGDSPCTSFGLAVTDSTMLTLRDLSSGGIVTAISDPLAGLGGPVFPMLSGVAQLRCPAAPPAICLAPRLPASVIAGSDAVALIKLDIAYASGSGCSPIGVEGLQMGVLDTLGRALDPYQLFDRIGFSIDGGSVIYEPAIGLNEGYTVFNLGPDAVIVEPGDGVSIELVADIEVDTPFDHFVVGMNRTTGVKLFDATDASRNPGLTDAQGCEVTLPFTSGSTRILMPAGSPILRVTGQAPRLGCPGHTGITILGAELVYKPITAKGDLVVLKWRGKTLERRPDGLSEVPAEDIFDAVYLLVEGQVIARDTLLAGNTVVLEPEGEFVLERGTSRVLELACDIAPDAPLGSFLIEFEDSASLELQDRDLKTGIHSVLMGADYPVRTAEVVLEPAGLASSFVNWPNPFNPDKEATNIGFVLSEDANVDIEVFTITGELIKKITINSSRPAGSHDSQDFWDGQDGSGHMVQPGTYFCRITARYGSGRTEEARRKVAVTR